MVQLFLKSDYKLIVHILFGLMRLATCHAVDQALTYGVASNCCIGLFDSMWKKLILEDKLHQTNASWDAHNDEENHYEAYIKLTVGSSFVVDTVSHGGSTVTLLATGSRAVKLLGVADILIIIFDSSVHPNLESWLDRDGLLLRKFAASRIWLKWQGTKIFVIFEHVLHLVEVRLKVLVV